jgi:hypothetical protein
MNSRRFTDSCPSDAAPYHIVERSVVHHSAFGRLTSELEVTGRPQQVRSSLDLGHDLAGQQSALFEDLICDREQFVGYV